MGLVHLLSRLGYMSYNTLKKKKEYLKYLSAQGIVFTCKACSTELPLDKFDSGSSRYKTKYWCRKCCRAKSQSKTKKTNNQQYNNSSKGYIKRFKRYSKRKKEASVQWADRKKMALVYLKCRKLNSTSSLKYCVNHVVPLISKSVCGLHNEFNLQISPVTENMKKSNKIIPNMV